MSASTRSHMDVPNQQEKPEGYKKLGLPPPKRKAEVRVLEEARLRRAQSARIRVLHELGTGLGRSFAEAQLLVLRDREALALHGEDAVRERAREAPEDR